MSYTLDDEIKIELSKEESYRFIQCEECNVWFKAKTANTKYCSYKCANEAHGSLEKRELTYMQELFYSQNKHLDNCPWELLYDPDGTFKPHAKFDVYSVPNERVLESKNVFSAGTLFYNIKKNIKYIWNGRELLPCD